MIRYRMTIEDTSHHQPLTHTHRHGVCPFFLPSAFSCFKSKLNGYSWRTSHGSSNDLEKEVIGSRRTKEMNPESSPALNYLALYFHNRISHVILCCFPCSCLDSPVVWIWTWHSLVCVCNDGILFLCLVAGNQTHDFTYTVLVSFPAMVLRHPDQSNFREKVLCNRPSVHGEDVFPSLLTKIRLANN